jgi:hypothetical protein
MRNQHLMRNSGGLHRLPPTSLFASLRITSL